VVNYGTAAADAKDTGRFRARDLFPARAIGTPTTAATPVDPDQQHGALERALLAVFVVGLLLTATHVVLFQTELVSEKAFWDLRKLFDLGHSSSILTWMCTVASATVALACWSVSRRLAEPLWLLPAGLFLLLSAVYHTGVHEHLDALPAVVGAVVSAALGSCALFGRAFGERGGERLRLCLGCAAVTSAVLIELLTTGGAWLPLQKLLQLTGALLLLGPVCYYAHRRAAGWGHPDDTSTLARRAAAIGAVLIATYAGFRLVWRFRYSLPEPLEPLIDVSSEVSVLSWLSVVAMALLGLISWRARRIEGRRSWLVVAAVFLFLSADDAITLHEHVGWTVARHAPNDRIFDWLLAYAPLLAVAGAASFLVLWNASREHARHRALVVVAFACLGAALGLELLERELVESGRTWRGIELYRHTMPVEEYLELLAPLLLLHVVGKHVRARA
jgi:hypothetical protein